MYNTIRGDGAMDDRILSDKAKAFAITIFSL